MMLSRVADSLYWMSRYLERVERTARILDVSLEGMLGESQEVMERRWRRLAGFLDLAPSEDGQEGHDGFQVVQTLAFDGENPASIVSYLTQARENARQVREQINSEMWEQLNRLYLDLRAVRPHEPWGFEPHEHLRAVIQGSQLIQGVTDSTMLHGEGWHFIRLGRNLERAISTAALLGAHFEDLGGREAQVVGVRDYLEWVALLRYCAAFEAYTKFYTADFRPDRIAEFLVLNDQFPNSVRFAAGMVEAALGEIAALTGSPRGGRALRVAGRLRATLDFSAIDEILAGDLRGFLLQVETQCEEIHEAVHRQYIAYPIASAVG